MISPVLYSLPLKTCPTGSFSFLTIQLKVINKRPGSIVSQLSQVNSRLVKSEILKIALDASIFLLETRALSESKQQAGDVKKGNQLKS